MALVLYAHPFASYCWKVLIALYENGTPFEYRMVDDPRNFAELAALWPMKKFPVLVEGAATLIESVGSSRVDLQACKLEYSIVSPK